MGLIDVWIEIYRLDHVIFLAAALAVSSLLAFAALKRHQKQGIYSIQEGNRIENHEALLVGSPQGKIWSWFAEIRAKFRYIGEGHHLMFAAFKNVCLPFLFVNTPSC